MWIWHARGFCYQNECKQTAVLQWMKKIMKWIKWNELNNASYCFWKHLQRYKKCWLHFKLKKNEESSHCSLGIMQQELLLLSLWMQESIILLKALIGSRSAIFDCEEKHSTWYASGYYQGPPTTLVHLFSISNASLWKTKKHSLSFAYF